MMMDMSKCSGVKHKRRYCRVPNCTKIVKSQGLCQRHGAKTRKCKVETCNKQAQGNFDGMCKSHFKLIKSELIHKPPEPSEPPKPPGVSVFDKVIPASLAWKGEGKFPLIQHLQMGFDEQRPRGWHRNEERRARGMAEVFNPKIQLEGWERELVWMEICLLSGSPQASFRHLARAWGRDKGFHMVLAQFICERQGNVERKKRIKGESVLTKKMPKKTISLNPGEDDDIDVEWDQVDLEMLDVLEGTTDDRFTRWEEDPTVNFSSGKTGKKRSLKMTSMTGDDSSDDDDDDGDDDGFSHESPMPEPVPTVEAVMQRHGDDDSHHVLSPPQMVHSHPSMIHHIQLHPLHSHGGPPPNVVPQHSSPGPPPGPQLMSHHSAMLSLSAHQMDQQSMPWSPPRPGTHMPPQRMDNRHPAHFMPPGSHPIHRHQMQYMNQNMSTQMHPMPMYPPMIGETHGCLSAYVEPTPSIVQGPYGTTHREEQPKETVMEPLVPA